MNKKISIITPVFNNVATLEKCLLSVKSQNYPNFEHIVIDGGSTDGTVELLKKHQADYTLKWISERDKGVSDAMQKGFNMASGEIFTWIDSDNYYLHGDLISKVMAEHNEREVDMVITNCFSNHEGSQRLFLIDTPIPSYDKLLNNGNMLTPECVFFTRELFFKAGGLNLELKLIHDYDLWLRMFKLNPICVKVPIESIVYVANDASMLRRYPFRAWRESFSLGRVYGRGLRARLIFRLKYWRFAIRYPFLKFIKKHPALKSFFIKHFR